MCPFTGRAGRTQASGGVDSESRSKAKAPQGDAKQQEPREQRGQREQRDVKEAPAASPSEGTGGSDKGAPACLLACLRESCA